MNSTNFQIQQVNFSYLSQYIEEIVELTTNAFLSNHEITKAAYSRTLPRHKHTFIYLFKEYVVDTLEEIERQNGCFFIAKENASHKIVAISLGRIYGRPAISHKFMELVSQSSSCFKEIMTDWWTLMKRFQLPEGGQLPTSIYHQTLLAVDPKNAGQGIGTALSRHVMETILKTGFVAVAIETSSASSHQVMGHLKRFHIHVLDIDSTVNSLTGVSTVFRLQFFSKEAVGPTIDWFLSKKTR